MAKITAAKDVSNVGKNSIFVTFKINIAKDCMIGNEGLLFIDGRKDFSWPCQTFFYVLENFR